MLLIVNWMNATRLPDERVQIERKYRDRLLELCDGPEHAAKLKDEFHRMHEPVGHKWQSYNLIAAEDATVSLIPSERQHACFTVRFEK